MLSPADFEPEFIAKSDSYLKEDLVLVKHVVNKRWEVLTSDAKMGVQSTMEGLFAILCQAVVDYSTDKQAKLAAAMNPAIQGDANAQFAGRALASAAQSHPLRTDANGRRVSPAGSAAADDADEAADFMHDKGEQLPLANANPIIDGLECPPPSSLLKYMLRGETDPMRVMQVTSLYFNDLHNRPSRYSNDYSTVSNISSKSGKSTSKSRSPECFYGKPADHGYFAKSWIFAFQLYLAAEDEHNPVAKAATYLRGDALDWWQQSGYMSMPPDADFEQFSTAFLKRVVKPADSAKARRELPLLKQEGQSVETYAAKFQQHEQPYHRGYCY